MEIINNNIKTLVNLIDEKAISDLDEQFVKAKQEQLIREIQSM